MLYEWESTEQDIAITGFKNDIVIDRIQQLYYDDHYDMVIEQTTKILEDLQRQSMTTSLYQKITYLLELRIMAWQAKTSYMNALTDARELIKYDPHDPKGYLWSGKLYGHLGKHEQGIEILKKGLKKVPFSPPNEHYHQKLKEAIQMVEKQCDQKKKDILISLPYELSCRILDQLCQRTLVQCSNVNSSWRTLVTNYPKIWRHIKLPAFEVKDIYLPLYKSLPFITHHIQELVVHGVESFEKCVELIPRSNFENLSTFKTNLRSDIPLNLDIDYDDIYASLTNVSDTLTSLDFDLDLIQGLPLAPILSILRKLTSIRFYATRFNNDRGTLGTLKLPFTTLLTTLDLRNKANEDIDELAFTVHEIQQLVRSSPHLQRLSLSPCPDQIHDEVAQHCPNIQQLIINAWYLPFMTINDESYGLKTLVPGYVRSGIPLESLLTRHASTLKTLYLTQKAPSSNILGVPDIFSTVNFPNLVHIIMRGIDTEILQQIPRMVQETSQLEVLSLENSVGIVPDSVFETLVLKFPNFKKLSLICCDFNDTALSHCLNSFATGSARSSSLEILDICPIKGYTNDAVLESCARIKSLTRLSIFHRRASQTAVESFARDVARLSHLEELKIHNLPMTEKDIQIIGENSSITNVYLGLSRGITREHARSAFSAGVEVRFGDAFDYSDSDSDSDYIEVEDDPDDPDDADDADDRYWGI